ncbi:MAG TPA: ABC transporter substrate-binding protein [Coriobacteriia bacterium]
MRSGNRQSLAAMIAVALAVAVALGGCTGTTGGSTTTGPATGTPIKVGAVLSLTGAQAALGEPEKNVIEMEVKRINEAGGINGHKLDVVIQDDASNVDQAVTATTKLIEQEKVLAIIGSTGTGQTMQMRGEIDKAKIPQVSLAGGLVVTGQFDPLVFQTPWSNALVVPTTLEYLKSKGFTKVGLITEDTTFGKDGRKLVKETAAANGLTIVGDEVFKGADTDMTAQLTVLKGGSPDVILMWSSVAASAIVPKNMKQLNMTTPLVGSHGIASQAFVTGAGDAAEGITMFAGKILAPEAYGKDTEGYKLATGFIDRYKAAYGKAPGSTFAGHAYDGLYLVVEAMNRLPEGFTAAQLRDEIEKTSGWQGIGGKFLFSTSDHNGMTKSDLVRYTATGGKWALAQ